MEKKPAFVINCSDCDTRNVQESTLAAYEKVVINAGTVVVSPESRALLDQYSVVMNTGTVLEAEGDVQFSQINGKAEIKPGQPIPQGKVLLLVNGTLDIAPGSGEILDHYCSMLINGSVTCPESLAGRLSMATINGKLETYPDDCIRLKRTAVLDRTFPIRAKQDARYYAGRRIVALDGGISFEKLVEKNVRFVTKELLAAEGLAESALPLFDEQAEITILPDGCAFVGDDATLDETLLRRYGKKLFICGDLTVNRDSAPCLGQVEYLRIAGNALVIRELAEAFRATDADYQEMKIVAGTLISDKVSVTIDRAMLERAADGVSLTDCVNVKFHKDVPPELIRERLVSLTDCVNISCTPEQRSAIELVSGDVVTLDDSCSGLVKKAGGIADQLLSALGYNAEDMSAADKAKLLLTSKMVNTGSYKL